MTSYTGRWPKHCGDLCIRTEVNYDVFVLSIPGLPSLNTK